MAFGLFEAAMLICFAFSWPFNIRKSYRARTNIGSSIMFMAIVFIGYLFGIANKIVNNDISYVLAFYLLDTALVSVAILVYYRNHRLEQSLDS